MAVFVSASDENAGKNERDTFLFAGWVAPEEDWSRFFAPAWQERVLDGPPAIPYLHMTEIRSEEWRKKHGISLAEAEDRVDNAFTVIDTLSSLFPIGISLDAGFLRDRLADAIITAPTGGKRPFDPDYLCFIGYVYYVLNYLAHKHPEAEKVDFVIEKNGPITRYIQHFHSTIADNLEALRQPHLARLLGDLLPASKDRVPLQAADVLCWHTARAQHSETMDAADIRRYNTIAKRDGCHWRMPNEMVLELVQALLRSPYLS